MKFLADENVGRLAKWLRILGYDAAYYSPISDDELIMRARAEGRIILTKDTGIATRPYLDNCIFIQSSRYLEQLQQVMQACGLTVREEALFGRCLECNVEVTPVPKESVEAQVPAYTFRTQPRFFRCPQCQKLFWPGTHTQRTLAALRGLRRA